MPPALDGQDVIAVDGAAHGLFGRVAPIAVVRDRGAGRLACTVRVEGGRFALAERGDQDVAVQVWGDALAPFCQPSSPVVALRWCEWLAPAGLEEQHTWLAEHDLANADPETVTSYRSLLGVAGPATTRHDVLLTLWVNDRAGALGRRGGGRDAAIDALLGEARLLAQRLETAGLAVTGPLSPAEVAEAVRLRLDPSAQQALARRARTLGEHAGVTAANGGPLATRETWRHWQVDDVLHRCFYVAEWPRMAVPADWMQALLLHSGAVRTVAVFYEPVPPRESRRRVERQVTKLVTDADQRVRVGFRVDAAHSRAEQAVLDREHELVAGHAEFAYTGLVDVCAPDADALDRVAAEIVQVAASVGVELRPLHGRHDKAVAATVPLARTVAAKGLLG